MMCSIYEITHIWTVVVDESEEWSLQLISNLSNWKEELKKSGVQRDSKLWPPLYQYHGGHGFKSCSNPDFFQTSSFQLLKLEINCDDHSSLSFEKNCWPMIIKVCLSLQTYNPGQKQLRVTPWKRPVSWNVWVFPSLILTFRPPLPFSML